MAKILGKTDSPYVPDADTHSLTLRIDNGGLALISLRFTFLLIAS